MRPLSLGFALISACFFSIRFGYGQTATVVDDANDPRHETLNQRVVSVLFDNDIQGTTPTTDWIVTVAGTPVSISGTALSGSRRVNVTFDATAVNGALYVLPGQALQISFTNSGTLTTQGSGNPVNDFTAITSINNYTPTCGSDVEYNGEGIAPSASVDQCSPVNADFYRWTYSYSLRYRNSTKWSTSGNYLFIQWNYLAQNTIARAYLSDGAGNPNAAFYHNSFAGSSPGIYASFRPGFNTGTLVVDGTNAFSYPDNADICNFRATVSPTSPYFDCISTAALKKNTQFDSYDFDDQNTGALSLEPTVANTDLVCLGTNVGMTFSDLTDLNCNGTGDLDVPPNSSASPANTGTRWLRLTYGTLDAGAPNGYIPNILVGGVPVTDGSGNLISPFDSNPIIGGAPGYVLTGPGVSGQPDASGVIELTGPVTEPTGQLTEIISTLSAVGQAVQQRFYVTMEYWGPCNRYDLGASPVSISTSYIEIIDSPIPPTVLPAGPFCESDTPASFDFTATGVGIGALTYTWYRDAGPATVLQATSADNTFNPVNEGPALDQINTTVSGSTTFHRYVTVTQASNNCTSPPTDIVIRIDDTNTGGTIGHPLGATPILICNTTNPDPFTDVSPGTGGAPAGTFTYQWESSTTSAVAGFSDIGGATGATHDPAAQPATTWFRRRLISGDCADVYSNVIEFRVSTQVLPGSINGAQTICLTANPSTMGNAASPTGGNGTYAFQWEESTVSALGPFNTIAGATANTFDPGGAGVLSQTTHYRRRVTSGVCSLDGGDADTDPDNIAYSNVITKTVDQLVVPGAIGNPQSICAGGDPGVLTEVTAPSGGNGTTYTFQWQQSATGGGVGFAAAAGVNTGATYDPPVLASTAFYRRRVTSGSCSADFSNEIQVTVNPLPTASNPTGGGAVCSGNPAPDIVWTLTGAAPHTGTWTDGTLTYNFSEPGTGLTATSFTVANPKTLNAGTYQLLSLVDANGCSAISLGATATITIGGTAPSLDEIFSISPADVCDDGGSTTDPVLDFSIDLNSTAGFTLTYKINGSSNRFKTFDTDASGDQTVPITFSDPELDAVGAQTITLVSILSLAGCQTVFNDDLTFTVNTLPSDPANPVNAIGCSTDPTGAALSVDDPGAGNLVLWFEDAGFTIPATGATGGARQESFTPTSNVTFTYFAVVQSQTAPTNCLSQNSVAVVHTQDAPPTAADAGNVTEQTCDTQFTLNGNAPNSGLNEQGYWTVANAVYFEGFGSGDAGVGATGPGPVVTLPASGNWTLDVSGGVFGAGEWLRVENGIMEAKDTDGEVIWESAAIDISTSGSVDVSLQIAEAGTMEGSDYIRAYYEVDGGGLLLFPNGDLTDDNSIEGDDIPRTVTVAGLAGNSLRILVRFNNNATAEFLRLDDVRVYPSGAGFPIISDVNDPTATVSNLQIGGNTLTWQIRSQYDVCSETTDNIVITRIALPVGLDETTEVCEDVITSGEKDDFDLTDYNGAVTGGSVNRTVAWFTNPERTAAVPTDTDVDDVTDGEIFYALITETASTSNCQNGIPGPGFAGQGSITITVNPLPVANNQTFAVCEETVASADKDNNNLAALFNDLVTGIVGSTNRTVTWYIDPGGVVNDPGDLITLVPTPNDVDDATDGERFYALVTNTVTICENIASVEFDIRPRPGINNIIGQPSVCASNAIILYQVTNIVPGSTYTWNLPPNSPVGTGFQKFAGGGPGDFFVLLQFPTVLSAPNDTWNISVTEISPNPDACVGDPNSFNITVEDSPSVNPIIGPNPVCKEATEDYQVTTINGANTYQWSVIAGDAAIVGASSGLGLGQITVDFGTSASSTLSVVEVSPTGCSIPGGQTLVVNANDKPLMTSLNTATVCSGQMVSAVHTFTSSIALSTFEWEVINVTGTITGAVVGNTGTGNINQTLGNTTGGVTSVTYRVTPTSPDGCEGPFQDVVVTINPEPVIVVGQTGIACSGDPVNKQVLLTPLNLPAGTLFNWPAPVMSDASVQGTAGTNVSAGAAIHISDVLNNLSNAPITATYTITPSNGTCNGIARTVVITVNPEPVGVNDNTPIMCSDAVVNYNLISNIATLGNNLVAGTTFSWVATTNGSVTGESTAPQTGNTINDALSNITSGDQVVVYTVTPTTSGCAGSTFQISVTVQPEPFGVNDTRTICSDVNVNYSLQDNITLSGNGLVSNFTWSAASNASVTGESTALQATATISDVLVNVTNADQVVVYTVTPTASNGCVGTPFTLTVTVQPKPVGADDALTVCSDVVLSYNLQNNVNTLGNNLAATFSWVAASNANVLGESTVPQAGNIINNTLNNITNSNQTVVYTVTPTGTNACPGNNFTVSITVQPEPRGISDAIQVCSDVAFNYALQNNVNTLGNSLASNFTWVAAVNGNVAGESTALQAGNTITDVLTNITNGDELVIYTITPTGTNGCPGNPFTVTVTVRPEPVATNDTKTICSDAVVNYDLQDNVTSTGNNLPSTFTWIAAANANVSGESTALQTTGLINDALSNVTNADQAVVYTVTPTGTNACTGNVFTVSVTVRPEPIGIDDTKIICSDVAVNYDLLNNVTIMGNGLPATFSWQAASNANVTGESTSAQSGSMITDVLNNITSADQPVVYAITPTAASSSCPGTPFTITITVRPEPLGVAALKTICSDENVAVDLQLNVNTLGNNVPANFIWVAASNASVGGESIVVQAGGTINDVLNNVTNADQIAIYTVTPTGTNGCPGNPFTITVTVRPEPVGVNAIAAICSDGNVNFDLQNNVNTLGNNLTADFSWVATANPNVSGESTSGQPGSTITDNLNNTTSVDQAVVYTVTPTSLAACVGNTFTVTVTVRPEPVGTAAAKTICSAANVSFDLQNNVNTTGNALASNFTWAAVPNGSVGGESTALQAGSIINDILVNVTNGDQVVVYNVTPTGLNGCVGNSFAVLVTVRPEPVGGNASASTCSDIALNVDLQNNVNTLGNSLASNFSWIAAANGLVTGESIVAQSTAFITDNITNVSGADQLVTYTVTPTGTNGCTGNNFTITTTIRSEPLGLNDAANICSDATVNYNLQNNINTLGNSQAANFTWVAAANGNVTGESTALQAGPVIADVLNNITSINQIVVYTVTPTGTNGCAGNGFTVSITVRPEPLGGLDIKGICSDENVNYDLQNNVTTLGNAVPSNFSWAATSSVSVGGESTSPQNTAMITDVLTNVTSIDQVVDYTVIPTGTNGCTGNPFTVSVTVRPEPLGAVHTTIACSDVVVNYNIQTANINALGNGLASNFTWIATANSNVSGESTTLQSTNAVSDILNNVTNADQFVVYTIIPTGTNGCIGNPFTVTVMVHPEPLGQNDTDLACNVPLSYDIQADNINALGNDVVSVFTYTVASTDAGNVPPAANRVVPSALPITDTYVNSTGVDVFITYTITPASNANGCTGNPFTYIVTIRSRPIGNSYTHVPNICSSVAFSINPQTGITNGVASTFTWVAAYAPGLSGGAGTNSGNIAETLSNTGNGPLSAIYTITPTSGPCQGPTYDITVIIDPQPVTDPSLATRTICSDIATGLLLNTNGISVGANAWDVDVMSVSANLAPNGANAADPGLSQPANYIQNDRFTNISFTPGTVVYKVTPIGPPATFCRGVDTFVTVTVNAEPVMNPSLTTTTVVCSDEQINVVLSTNGTSIAAQSYIYNDLQNPPGTSIPPSVGNAVPDPVETGPGDRPATVIQADSYNNVTGAAFNRTYVIKPKSALGCLGDAQNIPVQVLPEPDFAFSAPPPVCSDEAVQLLLSQSGATVIDEFQITNINWDIPPSAPAPGLLPGGSNLATGISVAGPNYTVMDTYTNGTNVTLKAYYKVRPLAVVISGKQCAGDEKTATVDVNPSPVMLENLDKVVCNDAVNGIILNTKATSAAAQSYRIVRTALPIGLDPGVYAPGSQVIDGVSTNHIASDHVINSTTGPLTVTYQVEANTGLAGAGCYGPVESVTVLVEPQITVTTLDPAAIDINRKPSICSADDTEIVLRSPSNPSAGLVSFNFSVSPSVAGVISGMSAGANLNENDLIEQVLSNSSNSPVDVTYTVTPRANSAASGSGCVGTPSAFIVSVEPKPRLTATPLSLTVCEGVPLGVDFTSVTTPSSGAASLLFQLTAVDDPSTLLPPANVTGFSTTYPSPYTAIPDALNDVLVNSAMGQQTVRYSFTPTFAIATATCEGDPVLVNVQVSPRPTLLPFAIDPKCSGESFVVDYSAFVTEADLASTLATWTFAYTPSGDPDISGASNGAGFELSQVVFNKNADPATVTYSFKAKAFNCESNPLPVTVQVFPVPKVTGVPTSMNVCNGGILNIPLNSNANNTQYTWVVDDESQPTLTGASDQATPVSGPINFTLSNSSTSLGNYTFEITPRVNTSLPGKTCLGDPFTTVANVAPPLDGRITTSNGTNESFICTGSREFLFLEFDGLPLFDIVYQEGSNVITLENQGAFKPIQITPAATTVFTLVSVKDAFGCEAVLNEVATVNVNTTDATFSVVGPEESCSPYKVSLQHNQQEGVNYTWKWFDGPDSVTYEALTNVPGKIIKHTFENPSPVGVAKFKVYLETSLADLRYPGCSKTTFHEIRVSPNIGLGVFPDITEICSGETVTFTNSSQGVITHRWFYRPSGTTEERDIRSTISASFEFENHTTQNPIIYEVVYKADNGKCPTETMIPITVYRGVTASFTEEVPPFVGGNSRVSFTNTSTPIDGSDFRYEWEFGLNSNPETLNGTNQAIQVDYSSPGIRDITLTATNIVAEADGLSCTSTVVRTINILMPPLVAAFSISPLAACFPVEVTVTENTSTGDIFKWQVIDQGGRIAATAIAPMPVFNIVNPGKYDVFLEASNSLTGQVAFAQINGVEVYDNPLASFEARPTALFIPDTELITFNFSTGANYYEWDLGDGTISNDFEPKHFYRLEGKYEIVLIAGNDHGSKDIDGDGILDGNVTCYDTARREVQARQGGQTKIPNAFTPNPNGPNGGNSGSGAFNDVFLPITKGVEEFKMQVYDRWGNMIFESNNKNQGWDGYDRNGNLMPAGVYVYKLTMRLSDGNRTTQVGDVTLIR